MSNWYQILAGFLDRFGDQVEGRSAEPLSPEQEEKLRLFAQGKLSEKEQEVLVKEIGENELGVEFLAHQIQELRSAPRPAARSPRRSKTKRRS